jgi:anti-sigma regulatory factor (Ser/Thr protein kinase)
MKESRDIQTIHLKLKPVLRNNELHRIFVTGRFLQSDYITNKWLTVEKASYVLDNDLSLVHLFSYRLIRNLDGKIPRNSILYLQIALQETIINAIEHGNLEIGYKTKTELKQRGGNYWEFLVQQCRSDSVLKRKVLIEYSLEKDHVKYKITDEGDGFDWQAFMSENTGEYSRNFLSTYHGVGLQMVKKSFDKIIFNDKGNEITLIKNIGVEDQ